MKTITTRNGKTLTLCPECKGDAEWAPCGTCGGKRRIDPKDAEEYRRKWAPPAISRPVRGLGAMYRT